MKEDDIMLILLTIPMDKKLVVISTKVCVQFFKYQLKIQSDCIIENQKRMKSRIYHANPIKDSMWLRSWWIYPLKSVDNFSNIS